MKNRIGECGAAVDDATVTVFSPDGEVRSLHEIEASVIRLALIRYKGSVSDVSRHLKIGRSTVYRKIEQLGIQAAD